MLADERVETALRNDPPEEVTMPEISTGHCHPNNALWREDLEMREEWQHKDVWRSNGKNFCVEVSRHGKETFSTTTRGDRYCEGDHHRWCVYVYIYPKHPDFARFNAAGSMFDQPDFGMHAGNSYFSVHRNNAGDICSYQVGSDYNHDGDYEYTRMATKEDARSVFYDAEAIFDLLKERKDKSEQSID